MCQMIKNGLFNLMVAISVAMAMGAIMGTVLFAAEAPTAAVAAPVAPLTPQDFDSIGDGQFEQVGLFEQFPGQEEVVAGECANGVCRIPTPAARVVQLAQAVPQVSRSVVVRAASVPVVAVAASQHLATRVVANRSRVEAVVPVIRQSYPVQYAAAGVVRGVRGVRCGVQNRLAMASSRARRVLQRFR